MHQRGPAQGLYSSRADKPFDLFYSICLHMRQRYQAHPLKLITALIIIISLTGCANLLGTSIPDSSPTSDAPTDTPTIIWFPPSDTPTVQVFPASTPTPDQKPGIGTIILTDDFSAPDLWDTAVSDQASIDVSRNLLTIVVQPGIQTASFRKNVTLGDFYAEITASPSLCKGPDEYGFLFRAPNHIGYYKFTLTCDGKARVDRNSVSTHEPLHPPILSGDVPPGAPGAVRLGVWAAGSDLHFFLNGRYQFSVNDRNYYSGGIGVFAASTGDTPVTVSFSNLVLYALNYSAPSDTTSP
jgi:hypothetical protein